MKKTGLRNLLVIIFLSAILSFYISPSLKYIYDICTITVLVYLFIFKKKQYTVKVNTTKLIYIVYFLIMIIICTIIRIPHKTPLTFTMRIIVLFMIIYRILQIYGEKYIIQFLKYFTNIMFILNLISIFEYINNTNFYYKFVSPEYKNWYMLVGYKAFRISSVFIHPIVYGNLLVILLSVLLFTKDSISKKYFYINLILILINLFGTQSRSCWIAFVGLLIFYISYKVSNLVNITKKKIITTIIGVFLLLIIVAIFKNEIRIIFEKIIYRFSFKDGSDISKVQRLGALSNVLGSLKGNIFNIFIGRGIGSISDFMLQNQVKIIGFKSADNQYVTMVYDMGMIFAIIYCIYVIKCMVYSLKNRSKKNLLCTSIIIVISINMFFYEAFFWKIPVLFFMIALILDVSTVKKKVL